VNRCREDSSVLCNLLDSIGKPTLDRASRHDLRARFIVAEIDPQEAAPRDGAAGRQHEIDQLNGKFWINRLSRLKRERLIKRFEKLSRS
jgi:peptide deformylase